MKREFLIALAREIQSNLSVKSREMITDIKLSILFEEMCSILKNTVIESKRFSDKPRIMVLGRTRVGKSVVMGDLLGHPLELNEINGASRVEYSDEHFTGRRPKIGHKHASETKGAFLYDNDASNIDCIDCAGFLDLETSIETDICNALSVAMMVKRRKPTAMIVVMPSTWITSTGMVDFLETLQRLQRIGSNYIFAPFPYFGYLCIKCSLNFIVISIHCDKQSFCTQKTSSSFMRHLPCEDYYSQIHL